MARRPHALAHVAVAVVFAVATAAVFVLRHDQSFHSVPALRGAGVKTLKAAVRAGISRPNGSLYRGSSGRVQRMCPFLGLFIGVELTNERINAPRQLGKEGDLVPRAAIALG